jgi:hypothetical protein
MNKYTVRYRCTLCHEEREQVVDTWDRKSVLAAKLVPILHTCMPREPAKQGLLTPIWVRTENTK